MQERIQPVVRQLLDLCKHLHKQPLLDNSKLHVHYTGQSHICVEFYSVQGHTQSRLGFLGVFKPETTDGPVLCRGVCYQKLSGQEIQIKSHSPEEAFEKMSNCLAPLLCLDSSAFYG